MTATAHPEPDWERAPEFGRRETILRTLRRLHELRPGPACIVETGTLRNDSSHGCSGDGWSTIAWGWYCSQTRGKAWTVDSSTDNLAVCRRATAPYSLVLQYVEADSVAFLRGWNREARGPIHLLYLDSLDYLGQPQASVEHHLAEVQAALPSLAQACLVLIDDTSPHGGQGAVEDYLRAGSPPERLPEFGGKGARAVPFLVEHGFRLEWATASQALLSRSPARAAPGPAQACPGAFEEGTR